MSRQNFAPQIPYGTRDFLPRDARRKREVETTIAGLFARWGYDEVVTPTFEYLDALTTGVGGDIQHNMFKFLDKNNRILALRPDMTAPIARVAATRLTQEEWPLRLFYLTNVFRYEQAQAGRQCEFYQAGVELMGSPGAGADAEIIALAAEAMLDAGLKQFQISLGQVEFINGIMDEYELGATERQQLKTCMVSRDLVGLSEMVAASRLCAASQQLLRDIPVLHGKREILKQAYTRVNNTVSRRALDNLSEIYCLLESYGVSEYVNFDLGLIRDFDYYTGMVFEGYTPGLGFPVCGGGRYDRMLAFFGMDCPATGFALGIERLLLAMERQGLKTVGDSRGIYVAWREGMLNAAIAAAGALRSQGHMVELALHAQSAAEAEAFRQRKRFARLIYCE
ncbi:MAG: ATP phosphoribosyltransferase regulatory subunit [Negativicutes bacterium]|nr:ATP phosphoribosyltransferase regulatory subunit [Negativicutes bacterium]